MNEKNSSKGLWKACYQMEISAALTIDDQLKSLEESVTILYECGVEVVTLRESNLKVSAGMGIGGIFLKRCLTDLRGIWSLLQIGYTSQAACIAAATFENALIVEAIVNNDDRAKEIITSEFGDSPWSVVQLCKFHADQVREESRILERDFSDAEFEIAWVQLYSAYKWLCKIKHPTVPSALHVIGTSRINGKSEYVIMAVPDIRVEDVPNKLTILIIVISRVRSAIRNFAFSLKLDYQNEDVKLWLQRFNSIVNDTIKAYDAISDEILPFTVTDKRLNDKYRRLSY